MADGDMVLPDSAIIVIVILGAAALVLCGYALHRTFGMRISGGGFDKTFNQRNPEQDQYMIDQRMAYRAGVMSEARAARYEKRHHSNGSSIPV